MKKHLISTTVFLLATVFSFGQDFDKFKIGFKIDPNISWLTPQDKHLTSEGSAARFGFGLTADIMFTENYALGTGINIDNSGGKLQFYSTSSEPEVLTVVTPTDTTQVAVVETKLNSHSKNYNLKYLEIPLTLKMRTNEIGYMTYAFQFGLGLGFNIKAMADEEVVSTRLRTTSNGEEYLPMKTINENYNEEKLNIKDEIKPLRLALIIGAGAEYNLSGNTSITAGFTFNNGFTNIFKKEEQGLKVDSSDNPIFGTTEATDETFQLKANGSYIALNIGIKF